MRFAPALLMVSVLAAPALANQPALYVEFVHESSADEVALLVLPDGSGPPLTQARSFGGGVVDASVEIRVIDELGYPVPNFPLEDIWIGATDGGVHSCLYQTAGLHPAAHTDADGRAVFTGPGRAGGASTGAIYVYMNGDPATPFGSGGTPHPPLALRINSPDINADGRVDLADVPLFATDYHGTYDFRSDFHWDGQIDLADVVKLANSLGKDCP